MRNKPVYLEPLKNKIREYNIVSFDVETTAKGGNDFVLGVVYDGYDSYTFRDKKEMGDFLLQRNYRNVRIFATNLQFDLCALYFPFDGNWKILMNGSQLIFGYHKKDRNYHRFYDSSNLNYFMSVKKMGKIMKISKLPFNFNKLQEIDWECIQHRKRHCLECYCRNDAIITYKFMVWYQRVINDLGGNMRSTIASTTMDVFRRRYLDRTYKQQFPDIIQKEYEGYYGGRTEVFQKGYHENVNYYDINSLYPFCMTEIKFPDTNYIHFSRKDNLNVDMEGMSKVEISNNELEIPFLAHRYDGKLLFPVGKWIGVYCHNELRKALILGYRIHKVFWSIYSEKTCNPFKKYIVDMYEKRLRYKTENNPFEVVCKILLNSLYGKFGQKINGNVGYMRNINDISLMDIIKKNIIVIGNSDFGVEKFQSERIPPYVIPIWSSYVTAQGKIELYRYLETHGPDNIIYCDTDSIFSYKENPTSKKLGDMKLEGKIENGIFLFPKAYNIKFEDKKDNVIKWKGIPREHLVDFWKNGFRIEFLKMLRMKEALIRDRTPNEIVKMEKHMLNIVDKRKFPIDVDYLTEHRYGKPLYILQ